MQLRTVVEESQCVYVCWDGKVKKRWRKNLRIILQLQRVITFIWRYVCGHSKYNNKIVNKIGVNAYIRFYVTCFPFALFYCYYSLGGISLLPLLALLHWRD